MAYKILRKLENGELLEVGSLNDLSEAKQLLESFNEHWPGDYRIQDSTSGADIDLED
jgi:hypothetical protein